MSPNVRALRAIVKKDLSLTGMRVLVGRARHQASALTAGLQKEGAEVLEIPFIEIRKPQSYKHLEAALQQIHQYDWLIFTSRNGVNEVWDRLKELNIKNSQLRHLKIAAIGPATKKAVAEHGLKVNVVPRQYVAESVVESLRGRVKNKQVLLARARVARDVIPRELRKAGARVDVVEAYVTVLPMRSRARLQAVMRNSTRRPDVVTFTSSSTVRNFVALLGKKPLQRTLRDAELFRRIKFASIGPITSATLRELDLPVDIEAKQYTIPGLVRAIVAAAKNAKPSAD